MIGDAAHSQNLIITLPIPNKLLDAASITKKNNSSHQIKLIQFFPAETCPIVRLVPN